MKRLTWPQSITPPIGPGTRADHGADSAARHPGRMWNRFRSFLCSWVRGSKVRKWFCGAQMSPPNHLHLDPFLSSYPPQLSPSLVSSPPQLSAWVDCCIRWVAQRSRASCRPSSSLKTKVPNLAVYGTGIIGTFPEVLEEEGVNAFFGGWEPIFVGFFLGVDSSWYGTSVRLLVVPCRYRRLATPPFYPCGKYRWSRGAGSEFSLFSPCLEGF